MRGHRYRPVAFYSKCFLFTWSFWIAAIIFEPSYKNISLLLLLFGLCSPAAITVITMWSSKDKELRADFFRKFKLSRIHWKNVLMAITTFFIIVLCSILLSLVFGEPVEQFYFRDDFTFSISGFSALLTILIASIIEEVGWRGYGEDAIASYCSWFKESILFGIIWSLWHLPLFWVSGTYHFMLKELGMLYVLNFFVSVIALGFLTTWVYVKNNRSIFATIIFHIFVNLMQERMGLTAITKCIETMVIIVFVIIVIHFNKEMFSNTLDSYL